MRVSHELGLPVQAPGRLRCPRCGVEAPAPEREEPLDIALVYAALGERDNAFDWLEKAYAAKSCWLFELDIDPVYDPIRDDPRFGDLRKRVGLAK